MKKILLVLAVVVCAGLAPAVAPPTPGEPSVDVAREASVTVGADGAFGSGVLYKNGERTFVWTDAHVVGHLQSVQTVVDPATGAPKVEVSYADCWVYTEDIEDGRKVGETRVLTKIVRFDEAQDIAVLYVYRKNYGKESAKFASGIPKVGDELWHVGSFKGPVGAGSVSVGSVSAVGRLRRGFEGHDTDHPFVYDQVACVAHKGSSGGGVFHKRTGECIGLVTEFIDADFTGFPHGAFCITPARRLRDWAKNCKAEWALDDKVKVPSIDDIMKGPVTLTPVVVPADFPLVPRPVVVPNQPGFPLPPIPVPGHGVIPNRP